jgi:hypothetical protein
VREAARSGAATRYTPSLRFENALPVQTFQYCGEIEANGTFMPDLFFVG